MKRAKSGGFSRKSSASGIPTTSDMADQNDGQTEQTPLLTVNSNGNGNGDVRRKSTFHEIFLDRKHTPGMESTNSWVRGSAHVFNVTKVTLLSNYVNILLVFVPLGIVAGATNWDPVVVFVLNFFAIVPLAAVLSFATEEISMKLGQTMGGLLNATFGNAVELIVRPPLVILRSFLTYKTRLV